MKENNTRISIVVSIGLHVISAFIGAIYIVQKQEIFQDNILVDVFRVAKQKLPKRRPDQRKPPRVKLPKAKVKLLKFLSSKTLVTTAVNLPLSDSVYSIPVDNRIAVDDFSKTSGLGSLRRILRTQLDLTPVYTSTLPQIMPKKVVGIMDQQLQIGLEASDPIFLIDEMSFAGPGEVAQPPRFVNKVVAEYPDLARRAQKEGMVILEAEIGVDGVARDIIVVQGMGFGCDQAAVQALRRSRFNPARQGKKSVPMRIQIPYRFQLVV